MNKVLKKILIVFSLTNVLLFSLVHVNDNYKVFADSYDEHFLDDICNQIYKVTPSNLKNLVTLATDTITGNWTDIIYDIYNMTISDTTRKQFVEGCKIRQNGGNLDDDNIAADRHGGRHGYFDVLNDNVQNDLNNGSNYNYYTNNTYTSTSNYSVVNNKTNNIHYTYNNQTYNYSYDYDYTTYNITNNSYTYKLTNNNYLTQVNNYNNTTIIDNGENRVLYYELPDGSNSLNLTEDEAINGYKTSLSVASYNNFYDDSNLIALYHFDGNEYDSAYPTNTTLTFDKNSVEYINSNNFNQALVLSEDTNISLNNSGNFYSFRFYPLIGNEFEMKINNTSIGSFTREYDSEFEYDEYINKYFNSYSYLSSFIVYNNKYYKLNNKNIDNYGLGINNRYYITNVYDSLDDYYDTMSSTYVYYDVDVGDYNIYISGNFSYSNGPSSTEYQFLNTLDSRNSHGFYLYGNMSGNSNYNTWVNSCIYDDLNWSFLSNFNLPYNDRYYSYIDSIYTYPSGIFYPSSWSNGVYSYFNLNDSNVHVIDVYKASVTSMSTNRSYNWINNSKIVSSDNNLINYNLWNYCAILSDGSVYINGNDTGIDIDNTIDFNIQFNSDNITYFDELACFNTNRSYISPSIPYDSNIVYSLPDYVEQVSSSGIMQNQLVHNGNFINTDNWYSTNGTFSVNNNICTFTNNGNYESDIRSYAFPIYIDHIYYRCFNIYSTIDGYVGVAFDGCTDTQKNYFIDANTYTSIKDYYKSSGNYPYSNGLSIYFLQTGVYSFDISNVYVIDLTLMFGVGYEPSKEWCDEYLDEYIAYNSGTLIKNHYSISSEYIYTENVVNLYNVNNQILIQSIIPVSSWKIGGYRPSNPYYGDVYINVDDMGYITSVQQFNSIEWIEVKAGLYNIYLNKWLDAIGFNIFNYNWEYVDYKYNVYGISDNNGLFNQLFIFLSDKFDNVVTAIKNIMFGNNISETQVNNNVDVNNNNNDNLKNSIDSVIDIEDSLNDDMNNALEDIDTDSLADKFGYKFQASALWVSDQYTRMTYDNPIGSLIVFSLTLGIALILIRKL